MNKIIIEEEITGNRQLLTSTNKQINHESHLKEVENVTVQHLHRVKYPCDY
jgi:hypothetical protein